MRFLIVPGSNSPSHLTKALALRETLGAEGHEALLALSAAHAARLSGTEGGIHILPDIQESDGAAMPTVEWFRNGDRLKSCILQEAELIRALSPDRVVGIFRFTTKAAAALHGVPYDSLACGCLMPDATTALGYGPEEQGAKAQGDFMSGFFRYGGAKMAKALHGLGLTQVIEVSDLRQMLEGDKTFLWDFDAFCPMPPDPARRHTGPIFWEQPADQASPPMALNGGAAKALVSFGTCIGSARALRRVVAVLLRLGFHVVIAAGGQSHLLDGLPADPRITSYCFASLQPLLPQADLLVCHGGQMTLFEAFRFKVPALVFPLQPEQAHNGFCAERLGAGARLAPSQPFLGNPEIYVEGLERLSEANLEDRISDFLAQPSLRDNLAKAQREVLSHNALETLAVELAR